MIRLLYYVFVWPFRLLFGGLIDSALVALGLKFYPATGPAQWRARS